jgi:acetyl-CoA acetyltransferase
MGLGPVHAIHKAEQRHGLGLKDADLIEINEAFAAQVIGCQRAAVDAKYCREKLGRDTLLGEIPDEILNVNGGAVALGHPIGASGARIIGTLIYELRRRGGGIGCAAICSGGGQGDAILLEVNGG